MIQLVLDGLEVDSSSVVADLYCGAGTFTLPLAQRADYVFAVESAASSVRDLRRNMEGMVKSKLSAATAPVSCPPWDTSMPLW